MEKLNECLINVCLKIAKRGEGSLIVVGDYEYKPLVTQEKGFIGFNVIENPKLLESLCLMDGAVILDKFGILKAYGVQLKVSKLSMLKNFGLRHNSAINASIKEGNKVYVVSEEDNKIRIYQSSKLIMEIDGRERNIEKKVPEINQILESIGWGTIGVVGAGILAPAIGLVAISGVTVFATTTGIAYLLKKFKEWGWIKI
jgi:DNA integrity scanning protein DisA with diadenylate cyclase activity